VTLSFTGIGVNFILQVDNPNPYQFDSPASPTR